MAFPDFLIIGAMKCGTSTLHAQLAAQPGVFMATPKEPNFFSDDQVYALGLAWYESLFADADATDLKGEASTHYTKLPAYPETVVRMASVCAPKLIYMIRNPIARAVSHHIHDWTMGAMPRDVARAFARHPELIEYGRYAMQIRPYVQVFGRSRILLVSLEQVQRNPRAELARIGAFLGLRPPTLWRGEQARANVSAERIRRFPLYDVLVEHPLAKNLRRALVPKALRDRVKRQFQMRTRPELPKELLIRMEEAFSRDFAELRAMFPKEDHLLASYPFIETQVA